MTTRFGRYIGVDYSGAGAAGSRLGGLQMYEASPGKPPARLRPPQPQGRRVVNWNRRELAEALVDRLQSPDPAIVGIDHAFSFPLTYFRRNELKNWDHFLRDFETFWPTGEGGTTVDSLRRGNPRAGTPMEYRLTEKWSSTAKSVFLFDVQGSVAKSSHAGIPWLKFLRERLGTSAHFWPFDGFDPPPDVHVIAETYPSLFSRRYGRGRRTPDQHDAYSVARWLAESDARGIMARYFEPPLTLPERADAAREGWILGIS